MEAFKKTVRVGQTEEHNGRGLVLADVFCKIEYGPDELNPGKPGPVLSISGVVGPKRNGDAIGGCGQIRDSVLRCVNWAPGWSKDIAETFVKLWETWHLNGMQAGCSHQRALGWKCCPGHYSTDAEHVALLKIWQEIETEARRLKKTAETLVQVADESPTEFLKPLGELERRYRAAADLEKSKIPKNAPHFASYPYTTVSYRCGQHEAFPMPCGAPDALSKPCPECGYKYGTAWLFEPVPDVVAHLLFNLPDADKTPAWV